VTNGLYVAWEHCCDNCGKRKPGGGQQQRNFIPVESSLRYVKKHTLLDGVRKAERRQAKSLETSRLLAASGGIVASNRVAITALIKLQSEILSILLPGSQP
jgi:hypothetical protein